LSGGVNNATFACYNLCHGPVAQLVEQRIENPRVDGSIPSQATSLKAPISDGWGFFLWRKRFGHGHAHQTTLLERWRAMTADHRHHRHHRHHPIRRAHV
jgi:hypothetical protein